MESIVRGSFGRSVRNFIDGLEVRTLLDNVMSRGQAADFQGRVALVTGGSRGLGYLLARQFAGEGCRIAICARNEPELNRARDELERGGAEVLAVRCDVADQTQVEHLIKTVTDHFGRIDVLVNNAGIIEVGPLESMTLQDFQKAMDVMFWGALYPTLAVLPQMRERQSGWIVNVTSIGGKISAPHLLPYSCAKFAAVGLSEGLRAEVAKDGISVTTIAPGLMRTGSYLNAFFKGLQEGEYIWFTLGAALPFVSMDAERAASQIVRAARNGEAERILSFPAATAARFHGLFPGLTADVLGRVNRLLPVSRNTDAARGDDVNRRINSSLLETLTALGRIAARRFNE
ncbi:MAG: SDR family oxidoreductase [Chloroflexota bacterium]